MICLPIGVEPVNPTLRTSGCSDKCCPTKPPNRVRKTDQLDIRRQFLLVQLQHYDTERAMNVHQVQYHIAIYIYSFIHMTMKNINQLGSH